MTSRHLLFTALLALSPAAGCLSAEPSELDTDEPAEPVLAATSQQVTDPLPSTAGRHVLRFSLSSGLQRAYILKLPSGYSPARSTPYPVVFAFHGHNQSADSFYATPGIQRLIALANQQGKILVFPNAAMGVDVTQMHIWDETMPIKNDNMFAEELLDHVVAGLNADDDRVYAAGFANGGHFAQVTGGRIPSKLRAIGTVSGYLDGYGGLPAPAIPFGISMPVYIVHGDSDLTVAYQEALDIYAEWYDALNCTLPSFGQILFPPAPSAYTTTKCKPGITHEVIHRVKVFGLGHRWPTTSQGNFDASAGLLAFFDAT